MEKIYAWLAIINIIISIFLAVGGVIAFVIIKFNDFKHQEKNAEKLERIVSDNHKEVKNELDTIKKSVHEIEKVTLVNKTEVEAIQKNCELHKSLLKGKIE